MVETTVPITRERTIRPEASQAAKMRAGRRAHLLEFISEPMGGIAALEQLRERGDLPMRGIAALEQLYQYLGLLNTACTAE